MIAFHEKNIYPDDFPVAIFPFQHMSFLPHWHNDIEIIHVYEGSLRICVNSKTRVLTKGESCICGSGDIHAYDSDDLECFAILLLFRTDFMDNQIQWPKNAVFQTPFVNQLTIARYHMDSLCSEHIGNLLSDIQKEMSEKKEYYQLFVKSSIYELYGFILRNIPTISIQDDYYKSFTVINKMQNALDYIHTNYHEAITLTEISNQTGLKTSQFSKLFRHMCGMSFVNYLNQVRVSKAAEMLVHTSESITSISISCGFNSIRNFNYTFQKIKGLSPSALRKEKID